MPTPEEAKRLWREGKTLEDFYEEQRIAKKREKKEARKQR